MQSFNIEMNKLPVMTKEHNRKYSRRAVLSYDEIMIILFMFLSGKLPHSTDSF